ncbi:unnamed protein product [Symbiodinium sp. CCMP2592]|nr:unnamed protein product [Symbiodinium sp. CCMP2592]
MSVVPEKSDGYPLGTDEGVMPKVTETTRRDPKPHWSHVVKSENADLKVENRELKQLVLQLKGRLHKHKRLSPGGDDGDDNDDGDDDGDDGSPNSSDFSELDYIFITVEFPSPHFNIKREVYFVHKHSTVSDLKLKILGHCEVFTQHPAHFALFRGDMPLDDLEFVYLEMKERDVLKFEMLTPEWYTPTNEDFITVYVKVFTNTENDIRKEIEINKFFTCRDFVYYVAGLFDLKKFYHGDITLSCDDTVGGGDMMFNDRDILDVMDGGWKLDEWCVKDGHTLNIKFGGRGGTRGTKPTVKDRANKHKTNLGNIAQGIDRSTLSGVGGMDGLEDRLNAFVVSAEADAEQAILQHCVGMSPDTINRMYDMAFGKGGTNEGKIDDISFHFFGLGSMKATIGINLAVANLGATGLVGFKKVMERVKFIKMGETTRSTSSILGVYHTAVNTLIHLYLCQCLG